MSSRLRGEIINALCSQFNFYLQFNISSVESVQSVAELFIPIYFIPKTNKLNKEILFVIFLIRELLSSVFCILSSVFCLPFSALCFLSSVFCLLYSVFCIPCSVFCLLYSVFCIPCSVFRVLCSVFRPPPSACPA